MISKLNGNITQFRNTKILNPESFQIAQLVLSFIHCFHL